MPHVPNKDRDENLARVDPTPGRFSWLLSQLINDYVHRYGMSYQVAVEIVGSLELSKLYWNNRVVLPYEARKCKENGDVY